MTIKEEVRAFAESGKDAVITVRERSSVVYAIKELGLQDKISCARSKGTNYLINKESR